MNTETGALLSERPDSGLEARVLDVSAFNHVNLEIARSPETGGQIVTHTIEVAGPQPGFDRFLARYRDETLPINAGQKDKVSPIAGSAGWRPGQRLTIIQHVRLPAAVYEVSVGFFDSRARRKPRFDDSGERLLRLDPVTLELGALDILQPSLPLLPADPACLLEQVLAIPAIGGDARDNLTFCYAQAPRFGHVLEFGVASGRTINQLAALGPDRTVWGFDTFEGLPEPWVRGKRRTAKAGTFSSGGKPPFVRGNVRLVKGLIQDTLPGWLTENPGKAALIHVDVDLYSAARAVLELLNDRIIPSTVIVFDDMAPWEALKAGRAGSYENWREGEWRALQEWAEAHSRRFALMSRGTRSVLAIRVLA